MLHGANTTASGSGSIVLLFLSAGPVAPRSTSVTSVTAIRYVQ